MAAVTIVMSADDARIQAAHQRLFNAQQKAIENYEKAINKSKEAQAKNQEDLAARKAAAEAEKQRLETIAKGQKLIEGQRTAQERYNDALAEAEKLAQAGAISEADLARRKEVLIQKLKDETGETQRAKEAEAQLTEAHKKAAEVIRQSQTPLEKYNAKLAELKKLADAGALSEDQLAKAQARAKEEFASASEEIRKKNTLLGEAGDRIADYVMGIGTATLAAGGLLKMWQQINDEQQKGFQALQQTQSADSRLLQISGNQEEFTALRTESDRLAAETGVDRNTVREVMFSGVSEGFMDAVPDLIKANQVIAPQAAAGVAGQLPSLFQGQIGALESVNLVLRAAKESRLNFEDLAQATPSAAEGSAIAKASPEETLAVLSVLASRFGSGQTAADRIKAFAAVAGIDQGGMTEEQKASQQKQIESAQKDLRTKEERVADIQRKLYDPATRKEAKPELELRLSRAQRDVAEFDRSRLEAPTQREEFRGLGIVEVVRRLQGMGDAERQGFLGTSQELNVAFTVLKEELPAIEKRLADLQAEGEAFSQGGGVLRDQMAIANADPEMTALRNEAIAQRRLEIANAVKDGISGAAASGAAAQVETGLKDENLATRTLGGVIGKQVASTSVAMGANQETAADAGVATASGFGSLGGVIGRSLFGRGQPDQQQAEVKVNDTGIQDAAAQMSEAAKQMQEAANKMNSAANRPSAPPPSITPAARATAETAGR